MRVLLLNPPGDRLYMRANYCTGTAKASSYWEPIDLAVQSGILSGRHEVFVIDAIVERFSAARVERMVHQVSPDAVFFITASCSWKKDFAFLSRVKQATGARMIASGGFLLEMGEEVMREYPFLDAILTDFTSDALVSYLAGKVDGAKDIIFRTGDGEIVSRQNRDKTESFAYPPPRHELFPITRYRLPWAEQRPIATVTTSLGCPFSCTFCSNNLRSYRVRQIENLKEELLYLDSLGIHELHFVDYNFIVSKKRAVELLQAIISLRKRFTFDCINRVDTLDEELCRLLKEAGCHSIQLGVESGDDEVLARYSKGLTTERIREGFALCKKFGIRTLGFFLIGLPGETEETVQRTIDFAKQLDCDFASFATVDPYIGTKVREEAIQAGYISPDQTEFDSGAFAAIGTEELSRKRVWQLRNRAVRQFYLRPSYIFRKAWAARSAKKLWLFALEGLTVLRNMLPRKN